MPPKTKSKSKTQSLPFIDSFFKLSEEEQKYITSVIHLQERDKWEGHEAVPPASVLDDILWSFEQHTAIPLELPFVSFMTILSGFLCTKGVKIVVTGTQSISPKIWVVGLANSGSSKTFTVDRIARLFDNKVPFLKSTASGVALLEALSETPNCVWVQDEFGKYIKQIQTQPHMEIVKQTKLDAYGEKDIEYNTKTTKLKIKGPAYAFLGLTVGETFLDEVGADSLVDGFSQRFNYVFAEPDVNRPWQKYPLMFHEQSMTNEQLEVEQRIKDGVHEICSRNDLDDLQLVMSDRALEVFKRTFERSFQDEVPESFYRRAMWSMFAYSAIYHILMKKHGTEIDAECMTYASRVVMLHLRDAKKLLLKAGWSEISQLIEKCEKWKIRWEDKHKKNAEVRDLLRNITEIKNVGEAKQIWEIMKK